MENLKQSQEFSTTVDQVCGIQVSTDSECHQGQVQKVFYFCTEYSQSKFVREPGRFNNFSIGDHDVCHKHDEPAHPIVNSTTSVAVYTCPMHPEVESTDPVICPKCGMELEAKTVSVEQENSEIIVTSRRFRFSSILAVPVFLLVMIADLMSSLLSSALSIT